MGTGGTMGITATAAAQTVNSTGGQAINLANVAATIALDQTNSGGGTNNVSLTNVSGTVVLGPGALSGATGASFNVVGGSVNLTYAGNINQANNAALVSVSGGHTGTLTLNTGTLSATNGTGLQFDNADGTYNFNGTTTLNGGDAGIDIVNGSSGTFSFNANTSITNPTGIGLNVNGGNGNITYAGSISKTNTNNIVSIQNRTGGTTTLSGALSATGGLANGILVGANTGGSITFSGTSKTLSTGANTAVNLTTNTGATIDFTNGGLVINTTSGTGFNATGGGTVTAQGTGNTITSTTGTALNIVNTSIGSGNVTFQSISSNGATNGIVLNNTGLAAGNGGLTVTGTGTTAGSGGTIQNAVQGALFTSTKNLSLSNMNFTNANSGNGTLNNIDGPTFNSAAQAAINMSSVSTATFTNLNLNGGAQVGINGQNVSNLSIANTTITGFGDAVFEGDVRFYNLTGTSSITNSTFTFAAGAGGDNLVDIRNDSGTTLTLTVSGSTFSNTRNSANGAQGLSFEAFGNANATLNVWNSTFSNLKTSGVEGFARDTSTLNVNITDGGVAGNGNTFDPGGTTTQTGRAIGLNAQDTAQLNFNINRNKKIYGHGGPVINIFSIDNATIMGRIDNNADIQNNATGSNFAGSPINISTEDNSTGVVEVIGNAIINNGQDAAISAGVTGDGISKFSASLDITIQNNNITMAGYNTGVDTFNNGILLSPGALPADLTTLVANLQNNTISGITAANGDAALVNENTGGAGSHLYLEGFTVDTATTWANRGNTPTTPVLDANAPGSSAIPVGHNGGHTKTPTNPNQ
ncbi:beta strand repeat-containing protein [Mesorhizobium sp. ORM8.1]